MLKYVRHKYIYYQILGIYWYVWTCFHLIKGGDKAYSNEGVPNLRMV